MYFKFIHTYKFMLYINVCQFKYLHIKLKAYIKQVFLSVSQP